MDRGCAVRLICGLCTAVWLAAPGSAKDLPKPSLAIDPIVARGLLAPIDVARDPPPDYRLEADLEPAAGQRARLSLQVGDSTLFAITGRLARRALPTGPLDARHARVLGQRRADSGKVYGAGIARNVRGVDLSATYQYSKLTADEPGRDAQARDGGPGRSHSLRATARIRF